MHGKVTPDTSGTVTSGDADAVTGGTVYTALTDGTVTKVGTADMGGTLRIVYLKSGAPTNGTQLYSKNHYINGTNYAVIRSANSNLPSIYAPVQVNSANSTSAGGGDFLISTTGAPVWAAYSTSGSGNAISSITVSGSGVTANMDDFAKTVKIGSSSTTYSSSSGVVTLPAYPTLSSLGAAAASHNHDAADVTSGTFDTARIPDLAAGKITSGTFAAARIPTATSSAIGGIKIGTGLGISSGTVSVSYGTTNSTACRGDDSRLSDARTPVSHASSSTTYGVGSTSNYGHLKVGSNITVSNGVISLTSSNVENALGFTPSRGLTYGDDSSNAERPILISEYSGGSGSGSAVNSLNFTESGYDVTINPYYARVSAKGFRAYQSDVDDTDYTASFDAEGIVFNRPDNADVKTTTISANNYGASITVAGSTNSSTESSISMSPTEASLNLYNPTTGGQSATFSINSDDELDMSIPHISAGSVELTTSGSISSGEPRAVSGDAVHDAIQGFATTSQLSSYLPKSGGTMTGTLVAKGNQYTDSYSGALNMNNSNIYGLNSIYTYDKSGSSSEGIHFYRTASTVDSLWVKDGVYYVTPNRTLGQEGTSYTLYHSGNTYNNKVTVDSTASTIVTTGTSALTLASKSYVDGLIAANDAMVYKGTLGTGGTATALPAVPYNAGWTYKVITAGTYAGKACEVGDMIICVTNRASGATGSNDDWTVVQNNMEAMKGATSSANGAVGYIGSTPPKDGYNTKYWRADGTWSVPAYPTAYTSNPAALGTASAGSSGNWARGDHVHPKPSLSDLGAAAAFTVETTGSGNAVTAVSYASNKITATKGSTFLTAHQTVTDGNPTLAWGTQSTVATIGGTAIHVNLPANPDTHNNKVTQKSWASNDEGRLAVKSGINDNDATDYIYFTPGVTVNGSTKVITAGGFKGAQYGGLTKTYELKATGYKEILQLPDAATYWTTNSGRSHIEFLLEASTVSFGTAITTGTVSRLWRVRVNFNGAATTAVIESANQNPGRNNGSLSYIRCAAPKTTSYAPKIAIALYNANTNVYIRATILEASPGWTFLNSIGTDPGTTNYNVYDAEVGRYNYHWSSVKWAASITGGCDGAAGWANGAWDTLDNDRHKASTTISWYHNPSGTATSYAIVNTRFCGIGSDGLVYQITKPGQAFQLPFIGGRAGNNFAASNTSVRLRYNARAVNTTELTTTYVANSANFSGSTTYTGTGTVYAYRFVFTYDNTTNSTNLGYPGKAMYLCGNLDANGNFVPYYTSVTGQVINNINGQGGITTATNVTMEKYTFYITQTPVYDSNYNTFLFMGKCDAATNVFTYMCLNSRAYTLNSSNKITHIDGKPIQDSTYTLSGLGGVPTSRKINGYDLTIDRTLNGADVKITGYSKPSSASALAATDTINAALGKLEKGLDGKQASGSYAAATHTHTTADVTALTGYAIASSAASIAATDSLNTALGKLQKSIDGKTSNTGTVTQVKVGTTAYNPSSGVVSLPAYPDVSGKIDTAGTGLSKSGTTLNHSNSVTAGTVGTSSDTSGSTLAVPYVTYDAQGHITVTGTHTHTVTGFLTSHQTIKQDGITGATVNRFGTCSTAAGTAAKTVSITSGTFPTLNASANGTKITVKFANANTAGTPTLNVNSKGAKNIYHRGAKITTGTNKALLAGVCDFVYDNALGWCLVGNYYDSTGYLPSSTTFATINGTSVKSNTAFTLPTLESVYPVGSIYMNASNSTNPATLLGFGTWQQLAPGRVLMGAGTSTPDEVNVSKTFTAGTELGIYDVTLDITHMPNHDHGGSTSWHSESFTIDGVYSPKGQYVTSSSNVTPNVHDNGMQGTKWEGSDSRISYTWDINHGHTINGQGGGQAHNNMQPYLVVYMWVRTE